MPLLREQSLMPHAMRLMSCAGWPKLQKIVAGFRHAQAQKNKKQTSCTHDMTSARHSTVKGWPTVEDRR